MTLANNHYMAGESIALPAVIKIANFFDSPLTNVSFLFGQNKGPARAGLWGTVRISLLFNSNNNAGSGGRGGGPDDNVVKAERGQDR